MTKNSEQAEPESSAVVIDEQLPPSHPRWGFCTGAPMTWNQAMALLPPPPPGAAARPQPTAAERYAAAKAAYTDALARRDGERQKGSDLSVKLDAARKAFGDAEEAVLTLRRRIEDGPVEAAGELVNDLAQAEVLADAAFRALRGLEDRWKAEGSPASDSGSLHNLGVAARAFQREIVAAELLALPEQTLPVLRRAFAVAGGGSVDDARWVDFLAEHLNLRRSKVDMALPGEIQEVRREVLAAHGFRVA